MEHFFQDEFANLSDPYVSSLLQKKVLSYDWEEKIEVRFGDGDCG